MAQLSPADRQRIIRTYAQTANGLETARRCGVGETTVRRVVAQSKQAKKSDLHARATARGIREGRDGLRKCTLVAQNYLKGCDGDDQTLEPQDAAKIIGAQVQATKGLLDVQQRCESNAVARLTRKMKRIEIERARAELELTRAKIKLAELDIANGGTQRIQHTVDAQIAIVELPTLEPVESAGTVASESGTANEVPRG